ncbi:MAG TPA: ABC transporter substrate-binding protein [Ruminococcaceae bacterium]|nr:ABC transporter substrate-binding protein [Oscillospiraceae bacterium]HCB65388.1 ABC transporter substrate-binding protein [Oscillospiraceae bacterium]HCU33010.1 ABC transporter substrate-binding protein [Oscillospiraceae bacterium]
MKKRWNRLLLLCCAALLITGLFAGCGAQNKLQKVTVSEVTHSVFYAPQYAAIELGFFEEEGLELELSNGEGADKVMTAVLSGSVDIGFAGPEACIYVYNEGKEDYMQVFAQLTQRDGAFILAREKDEDFTWEKLRGKRLLPGRKGGVPYMTLEYVVKQHGMTPGVDVIFDDSIQFSAMAGAFIGGTGDYVSLFEPTASALEKEGAGYIVASVGAESGEIPYTAYFAQKSFIAKNENLIQSFTNAVAKGLSWVKEHTAAQIAEVIQPAFPDTDLKTLETVVQNYKNIDAWRETPDMKEESFQKLQTVMQEAGELEKAAPFSELVNNSFAKNIK